MTLTSKDGFSPDESLAMLYFKALPMSIMIAIDQKYKEQRNNVLSSRNSKNI